MLPSQLSVGMSFNMLFKCTKKSISARISSLYTNFNKGGVELHLVPGDFGIFVLGSLAYGRNFSAGLHGQNRHSWDCLIFEFLEQGESEKALIMYQKWQEVGSESLGSHAVVALLKACTSLKDLKGGIMIHAEVVRMGMFEKNVFVGTTLVDMYAKCGFLVIAQEVFDMLPVRNVVSWNIILAAYVEHGHYERALDMYGQMQSYNINLDDVTFLSGLKACAAIGVTSKGREIHTDIVMKGNEQSLMVGNMLVNMYAKCGTVESAQAVFNTIKVRNVMLWNALITVYSENGLIDDVLRCIKQMHSDGISPSAVTYTCSVKLFGAMAYLDEGLNIHAEITSKGLETDVVVGSAIMDMYVKCSFLPEAKRVFDKLDFQDLVSWNALLAGIVEGCQDIDARNFFQEMQRQGISPDEVTYMCMLRVHGTEMGFEMHADVTKTGYDSNHFIRQTLIQIYAKRNAFAEAQNVFDKSPNQTVMIRDSLILGYTEHGYYEKVLSFIQEMHVVGFLWNTTALFCSMRACSNTEDRENGMQSHVNMIKTGLSDADELIGSALVEMYARCGSLQEMQNVFNSLSVQNITAWNSLMTGYTEAEAFEKIFDCLMQMQNKGITPDCKTFICMLKACSSLNVIDKGREMHIDIFKRGWLEIESSIVSILIGMYAKAGLLADAHGVFEKLSARDVTVWTTLIHSYSEIGAVEDALQYFSRMKSAGFHPLITTYACVLKSCGKSGSIIQGQELHSEFICRGLEAETTFRIALVEMYAKCGYSAETEALRDAFPNEDHIPWSMVLKGYSERDAIQENLEIFLGIQHDGPSFSLVRSIHCLRRCSREQLIPKGQNMHAEIVKKGLESEIYFNTELMVMYVKTGLLSEAKHMFGKLPCQTISSWNMLLSTYLEHGYNEAVVCSFEEMQKSFISPDVITLSSILKACSDTTSKRFKAYEIHTEIYKRGLEGDIIMGNTLVDLYSKYGLLAEAKVIFDTITVQTVVSWTALISGYIDRGCYDSALYFYEEMQRRGILMNAVTYICILKACGCTKSMCKGQAVHADILKKGLLECDDFIGSAIVNMYADCGFITEARTLFDRLVCQDVVAWTTIISAYVDHGDCQQALKCTQLMQDQGIIPDTVTHVLTLTACSRSVDIRMGRTIHTEIIKTGIEQDVLIGNSLIKMYSQCGLQVESRKVFCGLRSRNAGSWSSFITGCVEHGSDEEVVSYFLRMQLESVAPDSVAFVCYLRACSRIGNLEKGREAHAELMKKGFEEDVIIGNTLVFMYAKFGSFVEAQEIFDNLGSQDVVSWNILIAAHVEYGHSREVLHCFKKMEHAHVPPNTLTLLSCLSVCATFGTLDFGQEIHLGISRKGLEKELKIGNSLIDMYVKCASLAAAQNIFDKLPVRDVVSWNTIITGHAQLGENDNIIHLLDKMIGEGVKPDTVTFLSVLTACNHSGVTDRVYMYFDSIPDGYGLIPSPEHYNCIVDLLGRAGHIDDAVMMAKRMPFHPTIVVWQTVLGACKKWSSVATGRLAFDYASELNEKDSAIYICMYNIFVDAGMMIQANEIEVMETG